MADPVIEHVAQSLVSDGLRPFEATPSGAIVSDSLHRPTASTSPRTSRLGVCANCLDKDARYTCPRCSFPSCSLACSRAHKQKAEKGCDGQATPVWAKSLPANAIANNWGALMRDQSYISSVGRRVEDTGRDIVQAKLIPSTRAHIGRNDDGEGDASAVRLDEENEKESKLVKMAWETTMTELVLMPRGMSRRVKNQTRWDPKHSRIDWTTEVTFHDDDPGTGTKTITVNGPLPMSKTLYDVLALAIAIRDKAQAKVNGNCGSSKGKGKRKATFSSSDTTITAPASNAAMKAHDDEGFTGAGLEKRWLEAQRPDGDIAGQADDTSEDDDLEGAFLLLLAPYAPATSVSQATSSSDSDTSPASFMAASKRPHYLLHPSMTLERALRCTRVLEYPSFVLVPRNRFVVLAKAGTIDVVEKMDEGELASQRLSADMSGPGRRSFRERDERGHGRGRGTGRGRGGSHGFDRPTSRHGGLQDSTVTPNEDAQRPVDSGWGARASRVKEEQPEPNHVDHHVPNDALYSHDASVDDYSGQAPAAKRAKIERDDGAAAQQSQSSLPQLLDGIAAYDSD